MTGWQLTELGAAAFVASGAGVAIWRSVALKRSVLDIPNERSLHQTPTPRGGGALIPVFVVASLLFSPEGRQAWGLVSVLLVAAAVIVVASVSLWDDIRTVPTWIKLLVQVAAAVTVISAIGFPSRLPVPFGGVVDLGLLGAPLMLFWIVGLTNAYNFMDGIDGIAGLQAVIAGIGWAIIGFESANPLIALMGALIGGSSLGFLVHNWHPARIFMGDVGSATLGFTFAVMTMMAGKGDPRLVVVGALLLWPVLFDAFLTFTFRLRNGERVFTAHRTHLYQRLVLSGHTHWQVSTLYGILAAIGLVAALWTSGDRALPLEVIAGVIVLAAIALVQLVRRTERSARVLRSAAK